MTVIEAWINGDRNYDAGVMLYVLHGRNHNLKRVFQRGPDAYNIEKLASELEEIKHCGGQLKMEGVPVVEYRPDQEAFPPSAPDRSHLIVKEKPQKYNDLHKMWLDAYKKASYLQQNKLGMDLHKNVRAAAAKEIIEIFEHVITPCWDKLDYYNEHGTFPEDINDAKVYETPAEMLKRRNNLRTYITKFKDDPKKAIKIDAWKKEMDELNTKLDEPAAE